MQPTTAISRRTALGSTKRYLWLPQLIEDQCGPMDLQDTQYCQNQQLSVCLTLSKGMWSSSILNVIGTGSAGVGLSSSAAAGRLSCSLVMNCCPSLAATSAAVSSSSGRGVLATAWHPTPSDAVAADCSCTSAAVTGPPCCAFLPLLVHHLLCQKHDTKQHKEVRA